MYDKFEEDDSSWSFALGLLVGAIVGAAVASLFTPRSGAQNREAVIERGLVLRDRVTEAGDSVTSKVRDTATTVKDRATEGVERVGAAAGATIASVQDAANSAAATVSEVAGTAAERAQTLASTATERVQEAANTAAATVSEVATSVNERAHVVAETVGERAQDVATRVQGVAGAAAERARQITGREGTDEFEVPGAADGSAEFEATLAEQNDALESLSIDEPDELLSSAGEFTDPPEVLASEARYDAEDVRSAAVDSDGMEQEELDVLASIETFDGATSTATAIDDQLAAEDMEALEDELAAEDLAALDDELLADNVVALDDEVAESVDTLDEGFTAESAEDLDGDLTTDMLPPGEVATSAGQGWSSLEAAVEEAQAEVASTEQFEVDEEPTALSGQPGQATSLDEYTASDESDEQRPA